MKLSSESKLFISIGLITGLLICIAVVVFSQPAKPIAKSELILPTTFTRGNKNADTWLVMFSDFQCPACGLFSSVVDQLADEYPDELYIAYRHFLLNHYPESRYAAAAAESAGVQGKFWEMERLLFDNQASLSAFLYRDFGNQLQLDMTAFEASMSSSDVASRIEQDLTYGNNIGIQATPTFFLNGRKLELTSANDLMDQVEKEIHKN